MNNKIYKTFILLILCLFLFVGCAKETTKNNYHIIFDEESLEIKIGNKFEISYSTNCPGELIWSSSDEDVCTIEEGFVKGVNAGEATIYAKCYCDGEEVLATLPVKVVPKAKVFNVIIDGESHQVTLGHRLSQYLDELYNGITYQVKDGYIFEGWYSDAECKTPYDITKTVTKDIAIYSKYSETTDHIGYLMPIKTIFKYEASITSILESFTISPAYDGDLSKYDFSNYSIYVCKYDIEKEAYFVKEELNKTKLSIEDVPFDGFLVGIAKNWKQYEDYHNRLKKNVIINLNTYSVNTATSIYFDQEMDKNNIHLVNDASISASFSAMYDATYHTWLYTKNGTDKAYPASTTKIITALTALRYCSLDDTQVVGDEYHLTFDMTPGPSLAGVVIGEKWTLRELLYGMLLPSGNDAAYVIAALTVDHVYPDNTYTAREKSDKFALLMTNTAKHCGATNTHCMVPDGNDYYEDAALTIPADRLLEHYTCAVDMVKIARYAIACGAFAEVVSTSYKQIKNESGKMYSFSNTNCLIQKSNNYYYQGAIGIKTGTTGGALYCVVSGVQIDGRLILQSVLKSTTSPGRYADAKTLYDAAFKRK